MQDQKSNLCLLIVRTVSLQVLGARQATPQLVQLELVWRFWQIPLLQQLDVQTLPQLPQFEVLVAVSAHTPEQHVSPLAQTLPQLQPLS
jgi:hypothetical protein